MAWIKVESGVRAHRKFLEAGPAASWLWLCSVGYCQETKTDGFIPFGALCYLGVKNPKSLKCKLVTAGLWDEVDGGWQVHDYLGHQQSAAGIEAIRAARAAGGKLGGRPAETLKVNLEGKPSEKPLRLTLPETHQEDQEEKDNQEEKVQPPNPHALTRVDVVRDRFEMFWLEYPRKTGKDAAWKEWLKRSPDSDLTDLILAKVREQRASAQWLKDGGQFIPNPRTWLHQGRWQDVAQETGTVEMGKTVGNIEAMRRFVARGQGSV